MPPRSCTYVHTIHTQKTDPWCEIWGTVAFYYLPFSKAALLENTHKLWLEILTGCLLKSSNFWTTLYYYLRALFPSCDFQGRKAKLKCMWHLLILQTFLLPPRVTKEQFLHTVSWWCRNFVCKVKKSELDSSSRNILGCFCILFGVSLVTRLLLLLWWPWSNQPFPEGRQQEFCRRRPFPSESSARVNQQMWRHARSKKHFFKAHLVYFLGALSQVPRTQML